MLWINWAILFLNPEIEELSWDKHYCTSVFFIYFFLSGLHKKAWPEIPREGPKGRVDVSTAAAWRIMSLHLSGTSDLFPWVQSLQPWLLHCKTVRVYSRWLWLKRTEYQWADVWYARFPRKMKIQSVMFWYYEERLLCVHFYDQFGLYFTGHHSDVCIKIK